MFSSLKCLFLDPHFETKQYPIWTPAFGEFSNWHLSRRGGFGKIANKSGLIKAANGGRLLETNNIPIKHDYLKKTLSWMIFPSELKNWTSMTRLGVFQPPLKHSEGNSNISNCWLHSLHISIYSYDILNKSPFTTYYSHEKFSEKCLLYSSHCLKQNTPRFITSPFLLVSDSDPIKSHFLLMHIASLSLMPFFYIAS